MARNLMDSTATTKNIQVILTSEPPQGSPDDDRKVTCRENNCSVIFTKTANFAIEQKDSGSGYAWA